MVKPDLPRENTVEYLSDKKEMNINIRFAAVIFAVILTCLFLTIPNQSRAVGAAETGSEMAVALQHLYESTPAAKMPGKEAKGILVFPDVVQGGLIVGGQDGDDALLKGGRTAGC